MSEAEDSGLTEPLQDLYDNVVVVTEGGDKWSPDNVKKLRELLTNYAYKNSDNSIVQAKVIELQQNLIEALHPLDGRDVMKITQVEEGRWQATAREERLVRLTHGDFGDIEYLACSNSRVDAVTEMAKAFGYEVTEVTDNEEAQKEAFKEYYRDMVEEQAAITIQQAFRSWRITQSIKIAKERLNTPTDALDKAKTREARGREIFKKALDAFDEKSESTDVGITDYQKHTTLDLLPIRKDETMDSQHNQDVNKHNAEVFANQGRLEKLSYVRSDEIKKMTPDKYAVFILPKSDHNGAFKMGGNNELGILGDMMTSHDIDVRRAGSVSEAQDILDGLATKERKITFLYIGGHGNQTSLVFGKNTGVDGKLNTANVGKLNLSDVVDQTNGHIHLGGCSNGLLKGGGQNLVDAAFATLGDNHNIHISGAMRTVFANEERAIGHTIISLDQTSGTNINYRVGTLDPATFMGIQYRTFRINDTNRDNVDPSRGYFEPKMTEDGKKTGEFQMTREGREAIREGTLFLNYEDFKWYESTTFSDPSKTATEKAHLRNAQFEFMIYNKSLFDKTPQERLFDLATNIGQRRLASVLADVQVKSEPLFNMTNLTFNMTNLTLSKKVDEDSQLESLVSLCEDPDLYEALLQDFDEGGLLLVNLLYGSTEEILPDIKHAPVSLRQNSTFMSEMAKKSINALEHASESLKQNSTFMSEMAKISIHALGFVDGDLKNNHFFWLVEADNNIEALTYLPDALKKDKEFMTTLSKLNINALDYADDTIKEVLKKDLRKFYYDVLLDSIAEGDAEGDDAFSENYTTIDTDDWLTDLAFSKTYTASDFVKDAPEDLKKNETIIMTMANIDIEALSYASDELKKESRFMIEMVALNVEALNYADKSLLGEKSFIYECLEIYLLPSSREHVLSVTSLDLGTLLGYAKSQDNAEIVEWIIDKMEEQ